MTVSIDATPGGGATNIACVVYQQPDGMTAVPYPMVHAGGNTYTASLPPAPPGPVYYYYACTYEGFHAASPLYFPARAPSERLVYTNLFSPGPIREQDFYPFASAAYGTTVTNAADGWIVSHCFVSNAFQHCRMGPTNYGGDTVFAYILSPWVTGGIGSVSWAVRNYRGGVNTYVVQYSTDGTNWITLGSYANQDTVWVTHSVWVGMYEDAYVRIIKTGDPGGSQDHLYFDDILITPPPADVVISEPPFFSPGYPAKGQPVTVSVAITDRSTNYPAYNHRPTLHYQHSNGQTGVVAMTRSGGNTWSVVVPGHPAGTLSYYIKCPFDGYYYTNSWLSENQSPAFSPDAPPWASQPSRFHTYTIREFQSDYDYMQVNLSYTNTSVRMTQLKDREWQGILNFGYGTLDPSFTLSGLNWFTGTNYLGVPIEWGDPDQTRLSVPLIGTMSAWPSNITLYGLQQGQVVIRFNEASSNYTVQRCVYQDFDYWPASSDYFEESYSRAGVTWYRHHFDGWVTNVPYVQRDDFEDATWLDLYDGAPWDPDVDQGPSFWTARNYGLAAHYEAGRPGGTGRCLLLKDEAGFGDIYSSIYNPIASGGRGLGTLQMDFRCHENNWRPSLYTGSSNWTNAMIEATVAATVLPESADRTLLGPCWVSLLARCTDANNYYELRWQQVGVNQRGLFLHKRYGGTWIYCAGSSSESGYITTTNTIRFTACTEPGGRVLLEGWVDGVRKIHWTDTSSALTSPGQVGINTRDATIVVTNLFAGVAQCETLNGWPNISAGADTNFVINGWTGRRVYAVSPDAYVELHAGNVSGFQTNPPSFWSPLLPHGVGFIRFEYRNTGSSSTLCKTQWSTNRTAWWDLDVFGAAPSGNFATRDITVTNLLATNVWIRFLNATNASGQTARLQLDEISIHPSRNYGVVETFEDGLAQGWNGSPTWWRVGTSPVPQYTRPGYAAAPLKFVIMTLRGSETRLDQDALWISNAVYVVSNTPFARLVHPLFWGEHPGTDGEGVYVRVKHTDTAASLVLDNIQITDWHGTNYLDTNGWYATEAWVRDDGYATNCLELRYSRAYTNIYDSPYTGGGQYLRSPYITNGIGVFAFRYMNLGNTNGAVIFNIESATRQFTNDWVRVTSVTNTSAGWQYFAWSINNPDVVAVRILHRSTNYQAGMRIDNIEMTDYAERDQLTWTAYNALITPKETNRLFHVGENIKGGYLNYSITDQVAIPPMTNDRPYIQSAELEKGIGEISFWYRAWGGAGPPGYPARIDIVKTERETATNWIPLVTLTNITTTEFTYFTTNFYDPTSRYVRIYSHTTGVGRVCLDNVLITAPFGADISMTNLAIEPAIPLWTNSVHASVDLYDFFLNPQNIEVFLRYYAATNDWGTLPDGTRYYRGTNDWGVWTEGTTIPMSCIGTNGRYVRYRTTTPIPPYPIDQPVQYYAVVTFTGLFSEVASPKPCRQFVNPSHYYPVDLNAGETNARIPYYIVYSCPPGQVWINEINASDSSYFPTAAMQYVELCGRSGINISNWSIRIYSSSYLPLAWYRVTNPPVLTDESNGHGFWVFGDDRTTNRDLTMTINIGSPAEPRVLPADGGIRLCRSIGAYEHAVCYENYEGQYGTNHPLVEHGFTFIGPDDGWWADAPLALIGTGNKASDFTWDYYSGTWTPGAVNDSQTLLDWQEGGGQNAPRVEITSFWILGGTSVWVECTGTNGWSPWLYYCTNLLTTPPNGWTLATTNSTYANGTNTITTSIPPGLPVLFYRVVSTNGG